MGATLGLPGEGPETTFFKSALRKGSQRHLGEDLSGLLGIWVSFWSSRGSHFQTKIVVFCRSGFWLIFESLLDHFWGRAGVRGGACLDLQNLQKLQIGFNHALLPLKGVRRIS